MPTDKLTLRELLTRHRRRRGRNIAEFERRLQQFGGPTWRQWARYHRLYDAD